MKQLYEGKAKIVFAGDNENEVIMQFKNSLTASDGVKKAELEGKGELNWNISALLLSFVEKHGIPTHLIKKMDDNKHLCQKVTIFPIEIVCRNRAAGSFCRRYGVQEGIEFSKPIIEYFYKKDELHDPLFTKTDIIALKLASEDELELLKYYCLLINHYLRELFVQGNLELIDFKLEFGKNSEGKIVLADEITPDTMRIWKKGENDLAEKVLDKDRFRRDIGSLEYGYNQILEFLNGIDLANVSIKNPKVKVEAKVTLKPAVSDAAGETTLLALKRSGTPFENVRIGKLISLEHDGFISPKEATELTEKLLVNPLIENYHLRFFVE